MAKRGGQSKRIELEVLAVTEKIVGQFTLRSLQALSSATPVATGFARANWIPSTGKPDRSPEPRPTTDKAAKARARTLLAANMARAKDIAASYKVRMGPSFITNATPYLKFLNDGSSAQAPAKFVERAIEAVVRSFGGRKGRIKNVPL